MSLTRKKITDKYLSRFRTWIFDTEPLSEYFKIAQFPDVLTAGKNAFLINGSPELVNATEVQVELIDAKGNPVFIHPIRNFQEGLARLAVIEIYNDTPAGLATLTILGEVNRNTRGERVPDEWIGTYNVKWQRQININSQVPNKTPIRLYSYPSASVKEIRSLRSDVTRVGITATLSTAGYTGIPSSKLYKDTDNYTIVCSSASFTRDMVGGEIQFINAPTYRPTITRVLNETMVHVSPPYAVDGIPAIARTTGSLIHYTGSVAEVSFPSTHSFAKIDVDNLLTIAGDIYRAKVFMSPADANGDFRFVGDYRVGAPELMMTESLVDGRGLVDRGDIYNQNVVTTEWVSGVYPPTNVDFYVSGS